MKRARHWAIVRQSIWYLVLAPLLLLAIGIAHYYSERSVERARLLTSETLNVELGRTAIVKALENVAADLAYLAAHNQARDLFRADDDGAKAALAKDFLTFVAKKRLYDHIRFIDSAGIEQVRVNFNAGDSYIVAPQDLQNKSGRYYVEAARKLKPGEIYVSPFDLNVEQGRIEQPLKPVIRIATPVLDSTGKRSGMLLLNYLGGGLLRSFRTATANVSDHVMLVNAQGFWMSSPQREEEWGFMLGRTQTFASRFASAWERIHGGERAQIETDTGIFTSAAIDPVAVLGGRAAGSTRSDSDPGPWWIIAHVPHTALLATPANFVAWYLPLYLAMLALLTVAALLIGRATLGHRLAEAQVAFEQRFRGILERIQLKVVSVDREGKVTLCNDALLELLGRERADVIGRDWIEALVAPEARKECRTMMARLLQDESPPSPHESWLSTRDESRRLVVWNGAMVLDSEGQVAGFTFLGEDITEARRAEQELRKLSSAVEQSPNTVMITDLAGSIEYVNPKFTVLTGYQLDEVRGLNPSVLKTGKTTGEEYAEMWHTITSGGVWRGIFQNRKKNGETYWESANISAVRNREGEISHFLAVKEDITEQRILEQRFRCCVESAPNGILLVDDDGRVVLVNREIERMFGYDREELLGNFVEMLVPEAARSTHAGLRQGYRDDPSSRAMGVGLELAGQHRDGHTFPIEVGLHVVESDEGIMTLAAIVDITERRRLEVELDLSNQEVAKSEALAAVGQMANMVAHDLRNPLSSIKMGLQIMGKLGAGRWGKEEAELHGIALEQVRYMEEVLDDLLSYSRENHLALEWLQVNKVLDAAILLVQKHIEEGDVKVTARYQSGLPTLHGDPVQLRRAFCNLLLNGIQATKNVQGRRPEITISTDLELAPDRPKIRISIHDNGHGLAADAAARAFDPFFTTRAMGTGLGLAIVKRIIEKHDGTVELVPGDVCGTCAQMVLPTAPIDGDTRRQDASASDAPAQHAAEEGAISVETTW